MSSCPYSEEKLDEFQDVANPMGPACRECSDCQCIHWDGDCPCDREDCPDPDRATLNVMQQEELKQEFGGK
jgi:hypothetical protein